MMGLAKRPLSNTADLSFYKLCGSGGGAGFMPRINIDVFAILCVWPDKSTAEARLSETPVFERYRNRAAEDWTVYLHPVSSRGAWSGKAPFVPEDTQIVGPLAALTRATLSTRSLLQFWKRVPAIDDMISHDPNVTFKIGIGEVPLVQQVTFSIWPDTQTMAAFARDRTGLHAKAIQAVRDGNWFREELYARFRIIGETGSWNGESPLKTLNL